MANYYATARTNYVTIINQDGLNQALQHFEKMTQVEQEGKTAFLAEGDSGTFPSYANWTDAEGKEHETEFSWVEHVMPYIAEGEVLVTMEAGAEKLRFIIGYAQAFVRRGDKVRKQHIDLSGIYKKAAKAFAVEQSCITVAEY